MKKFWTKKLNKKTVKVVTLQLQSEQNGVVVKL
jgi:hypothetical protein